MIYIYALLVFWCAYGAIGSVLYIVSDVIDDDVDFGKMYGSDIIGILVVISLFVIGVLFGFFTFKLGLTNLLNIIRR